MDNIVQTISIEDIIPSKFQPNNDERQKIEELAQLIKTFGLIDPILVRSKNDKYEIILGAEKYEAAKLAGLDSIPVLVKEIDDKVFSKYKNLDNQNKKLSSISSTNNNFTIPLEDRTTNINNLSHQEKYYTNNNQDIVSLKKLNQEEYERNDFKMNNEQLNNNMMNNNFGTPTPAMDNDMTKPAFGGKFFPSLEDEPTNMNMGSMPVNNFIPQEPTLQNNIENNNLIDLTDISLDKQPVIDNITPNIEMPTQQVSATPEIPGMTIGGQDLSMNQAPINDFTMNQAPQLDNQNISMPQNNFEIPASPMQPINNKMPNTINIDDLPNMNAPLAQPQFDLSQNININQPQDINPIPTLQQANFGVNEPMVESPEINSLNQQLNQAPPIMNQNFDLNQQPLSVETSNVSQKDITPVANTIKSLVSNLETFGYKINITEENLMSSTKITIEIEK